MDITCMQKWLENTSLSSAENKQFNSVTKEFQDAIYETIENFINHLTESSELQPLCATKSELVYRILVFLSGLHSKSQSKRFLTNSGEYSSTLSTYVCYQTNLHLTLDSKSIIFHLLKIAPVTPNEKRELYLYVNGNSLVDSGIRNDRLRSTTGRLMGSVPQIPLAPFTKMDTSYIVENGTSSEKMIINYQRQIIQSVNSNQLTIISGPPGSGKTIYLPQILIDECHKQGHRSRIICTQPYRLYAHINAERLALLRREAVGQTVGYQIRLESKVSPKTILTFCTHGVLLRTIYADSKIMAGITHIIVDEIEEEEIPENLLQTKFGNVKSKLMKSPRKCADNPEKGCGILLGIIPLLLKQYKHLKVILIINSRLSTYYSLHKDIPCNPVNILGISKSNSLLSDIGCENVDNDSNNSSTVIDLKKNSVLHLTNMERSSSDSTFPPSATTNISPALKVQNDIPFIRIACEPVQSFSEYFSEASVISLPYSPHRTRVYYLEDILEWTNYSTPQMNEVPVYMAQDYVRCYNMYFWLTNKESDNHTTNEFNMSIKKEANTKQTMFPTNQFVFDLESGQTHSSTEDDPVSKARESVNNLLWTIWNVKVLVSNNSELKRYHMKENDETEIRTRVYLYLTNLLQFVLAGWISVDYPHSDSGLTPLMVCSAAGLLEAVKSLLSLGANPFIRVAIPYDPLITSTCKQNGDFKLFGPKYRKIMVSNRNYTIVGVTAYDLARIFNNNEVENLLKTYMITSSLRNESENWEAILLRFGSWFQSPISKSQYDNCVFDDYETVVTQIKNVEKINEFLHPKIFCNKSLLSYQLARNTMESETAIDYDLLTSLIVKIDSSLPKGTILIFLPSYEEIMILRGRLQDPNTAPWKSQKKPIIFILHSRMFAADLKTIYSQSSCSLRKIILSSNIAESCMTFNDVVYVVDCGLNRIEEYLDCTQTTSLRNQWILKSNAIQRQTRTGANVNGICFRLYSSLRFNTFFEQRQDSLRGHAVEEACIQARLLGPPNISIQTVLNTLPKPPSPESSENAIKTLKEMDALNSFEGLTELGYHINDLPIPAHYAKMVLFSVVLKCLDPILTIASILAYTEPFTLPKNASERRDLMNIQRYLSSDSYSDHIVLLRAFQFWQKSRSEGWEKMFCQKHFISTAIFEVIVSIRTQLLGQLRASGFIKTKGNGDIRDLNSNSENWAVVKAAVVAGMYGNLAQVDRRNSCLRTANRNLSRVVLDPHSVVATDFDGAEMNVNKLPCDWLVFNELLTLTDRKSHISSKYNNADHANLEQMKVIRCVSVVSTVTVALMAGPIGVYPQILNESHSTVIGRNLKTSSDDLQKQNNEQSIYSSMDRKHDVYSGKTCVNAYEVFGNVLESDSNLEIDRVIKLFFEANSQSQTNVHPNIYETLISTVQPKLVNSNVHNIMSDSGALFSSNFISSELNDSLRKMSVDFNSIKSSDNLDSVELLPLKQQETMHIHPQTNTASQSSISQKNDKVSVCLDTNTSLCFTISPNEAQMVIELRQKWHALLLRRLKNPGKQCSQQDEAVLRGLINVLTTEEKALGLRQPSGIGARPRPMVTELYNQVDYSQGYCFQDMKTANEQPLNKRYISTTCATTDNIATLPVSLTNTSLLKLNDAICSSAFTNSKCMRDLNVSDLNGIFKQHLPQTCKIDISRSTYNPTNQINNSSTEKWRHPLSKKITDNTDYMSLSQQSNVDILLPEDGILPISNLMLDRFNRPVTIQNYQFDPLSNLKPSISENNKHRFQKIIMDKVLCNRIQNHRSAIMEDEICSYILYGSHTPNMAIPNLDATHPTTTRSNITMKNIFQNFNDAISTSKT
ncbi:putative ATP-dependent RNA helicase YTHDC2 [Schistosoma japonicum]|uniref:Putative ATP-dependent RNA helicase YTHDC2 n=1 Tax=Schistosoma japonicum TaxID=6182 RepID=A0A4Z2CTA2_SCHJA|nr:putative ATP-dependent RNA helicase YTHDC2 [Schistosoma japonicum]